MKFELQKIDDGVRFTAADGWCDLALHGDGRASLRCGTFNGTAAEVFGARLWKLLCDSMPELGLKVVGAECEPGSFVERILWGASFQRDGTRRSWLLTAGGLRDVALYSILDSEVRYEIEAPVETPLPAVEAELEP